MWWITVATSVGFRCFETQKYLISRFFHFFSASLHFSFFLKLALALRISRRCWLWHCGTKVGSWKSFASLFLVCVVDARPWQNLWVLASAAEISPVVCRDSFRMDRLIAHYRSQMLVVLIGVLPALWAQRIGASVLVADMTMSRMVELNADAPFCALYNDRGIIQRMVLGTDPRKVRQMSSNLVADLEETCKASRDKGKVRRILCPRE